MYATLQLNKKQQNNEVALLLRWRLWGCKGATAESASYFLHQGSPGKSYSGLLAWDGVHHVQQDSALEEPRQLCHDNLSAARRDVVNKQTQEQRQQQGKGKRKSSTGGDGIPASKAKGAPPPSPVSPRASGSASSSWGWSSWNWSEWGEQRQWDRRSQDWSSSQGWWHRR